MLEQDLAPEPMDQLARWIADASSVGMIEPTAMTLATVGADGRPSARIVLYKGPQNGGLSFFTNYDSRKGNELSAGAPAALVFWWDRLERQVRVEGPVHRLPRELSESYFRRRPRASQISAYASHQSRVVASRRELEQRFADNETRFEGRDVPLPDGWGGYVLQPGYFEFWQGQPGRLHDRITFRRAGGAWRCERLEP
ncbi:MAG TPA: pyridoxamine 5'-phosphate oxidase [Verrucomicrobiae bacterium]|nr:pyridoxamine 5'-phosphate oxidase [Verrucomicrobiae bacterium]